MDDREYTKRINKLYNDVLDVYESTLLQKKNAIWIVNESHKYIDKFESCTDWEEKERLLKVLDEIAARMERDYKEVMDSVKSLKKLQNEIDELKRHKDD
jgi:hypothetical protein